MKKTLCILLIACLNVYSFEIYNGMGISEEASIILANNYPYKIEPDSKDELLAVLECKKSGVSNRLHRYVDFLIYGSKGKYKYMQMVYTNKKKENNFISPLMNFIKEDGNGDLYFINVPVILMVSASMPSLSFSSPGIKQVWETQYERAAIKIDPVTLGVRIFKSPGHFQQAAPTQYLGKNCRLLDNDDVRKDIDNFYMDFNKQVDAISETLEEVRKF